MGVVMGVVMKTRTKPLIQSEIYNFNQSLSEGNEVSELILIVEQVN